MKKVSRLVLVGIIVILVASVPLLSGCRQHTLIEVERVEAEKDYSIEKLTPEWIMIRAEKSDKGYYAYFSESLGKGIKELDRSYEIITIVPITARRGDGSATQALLVKVKSKY